MHSTWTGSSELDLVMHSPFSHLFNPDLDAVDGPNTGSHPLTGQSAPNVSWDKRRVRKQRRRIDDESCSPKRRKLMSEARHVTEYANPTVTSMWLMNPTSSSSSSSSAACSFQQQSTSTTEDMSLTFASPLLPLQRNPIRTGMEVEAAQKRLREIEDRITLEDDSDEEELDVEPAQHRPVLVMSDSLREGLQRGIGDILPHTVTQSMNQSCMELVVWRPPQDPLTQRIRSSTQRSQRKPPPISRQTPPPVPYASRPQFSPSTSLTFSCPAALDSQEEDMEL